MLWVMVVLVVLLFIVEFGIIEDDIKIRLTLSISGLNLKGDKGSFGLYVCYVVKHNTGLLLLL